MVLGLVSTNFEGEMVIAEGRYYLAIKPQQSRG
jgi:hypothetical protein